MRVICDDDDDDDDDNGDDCDDDDDDCDDVDDGDSNNCAVGDGDGCGYASHNLRMTSTLRISSNGQTAGKVIADDDDEDAAAAMHACKAASRLEVRSLMAVWHLQST
jgi:hypothetical protein